MQIGQKCKLQFSHFTVILALICGQFLFIINIEIFLN